MSRSQNGSQAKSGLHPRNKHRFGYDFDALQKVQPELADFVKDIRGRQSVDFSDPQAVRCLNQALLKYHYGIAFWELPEGYLCPPVPGRADYVHHLADLLAATAGRQEPPKGRQLRGLDIGAGANGIYPLLAAREYGWKMLGSDIDPLSVQTATLVAQSNPGVKNLIEYRLQPRAGNIFNGLVATDEVFDFTMCNPPFHASAEDAQAGNRRKVANLSRQSLSRQSLSRQSLSRQSLSRQSLSRQKPQTRGQQSVTEKAASLNFGGQNNELWCNGGEAEFISRMIRESKEVAGQCLWFTSLVSKQDNLPRLKQQLKKACVAQVRVIEMAQGQKISRFIAWTFMTQDQQQAWTESWR